MDLTLAAQAVTTEPITHAAVGQWVLIAVLLFGGMGGVGIWLGRNKTQARKIDNDPLNVQPAPQFVSQAEANHRFGAIEKDLDQIRDEMHSHRLHFDDEVRQIIDAGQKRVQALRAEITDASARTHERIDEVLKSCSRMEGVLEVLRSTPAGTSSKRSPR